MDSPIQVSRLAGPLTGRLSACLPFWETLTKNTSLLDSIKDGLLVPVPPSFSNAPFLPERSDEATLEEKEKHMASLVADGTAVEIFPPPQPEDRVAWEARYNWTPAYMIVKPATRHLPPLQRKLRMILASLRVNRAVPRPPSFKMAGVKRVAQAVISGDWACTIDLTSAYSHLAYHEASVPLFAFRMGGRCYVHRGLSFGYTWAPIIFHSLMWVIGRDLRRRGHRVYWYLDDWLALGRTPREATAAARALVEAMGEAGFQVNEKKSTLIPSQTWTHLGVVFDSVRMVATVEASRVAKIRRSIHRFLDVPRYRTRRELMRIVGGLEFCLFGFSHHRRHLHPLHALLRSMAGSGLDTPWPSLNLSQEVSAAFLHWQTKLRLCSGRPLQQSLPEIVLTTDSSPHGWGAVLSNLDGTPALPPPLHEAAGVWMGEQRELHQNEQEMLGVECGLRSFPDQIRGKHLLVETDNGTVASYLLREGGRRPLLRRMTARIFDSGLFRSLQVRWLSSKDNAHADALSRLAPDRWAITVAGTWVDRICNRFGVKPTVDAFATIHNTRFPRFFSRFAQPTAAGQDAFLQDWRSEECLWAFPPPALLPRVLAKARAESATMVLIALAWNSLPEFPLLRRLASSTWHVGTQNDFLVQGHGETSMVTDWRFSAYFIVGGGRPI